jgi:hypothetical protein
MSRISPNRQQVFSIFEKFPSILLVLNPQITAETKARQQL